MLEGNSAWNRDRVAKLERLSEIVSHRAGAPTRRNLSERLEEVLMVLPVWKNMAFEMPRMSGTGPELPYCGACGSDEYLVFEEYVPSRLVPGEGLSPGETSYSCMKCGQFNAHPVPSGWEPPGWFWYA